jgi:hypothetical protein
MHTYRQSKLGESWTVGHYQMQQGDEGASYEKWHPMQDFSDEVAAAAYVNYLNGGDGEKNVTAFYGR